MREDIVISGQTYNGIDTISVKKTDDGNAYYSIWNGIDNGIVKDVTFFDYEGTIIASYTKEEFLSLTSMPTNPTHDGLVAEGWNWTLSDAKEYVSENGKLHIGQMYRTASGQTEYYVEVNESTGFTVSFNQYATQSKDWGDGTRNTSTTHTYSQAGNYIIKTLGAPGNVGRFFQRIPRSKQLRAVRIGSGEGNVAGEAFSGCRKLQYVTFPQSVINVGELAFRDCFGLKYVTIPKNATIKSEAFAFCRSLLYVSFPKESNDLMNNLFQGCVALQGVTLPISTAQVGHYLGHSICYATYSLRYAIIPNGTEKFSISGSSQFFQGYSLQSVVIPRSVTDMGSSPFQVCDWLREITVLAQTPPTLRGSSTSSGPVPSLPDSVEKINIPHGTLSAYQSSQYWSQYSSKFVELPA